MKSFNYTIKDKIGIHARPAGLLAKQAKEFSSEILIKVGGKQAAASKLIAVMGLGVKFGDEITVEVTGEDENEAAKQIEEFFKNNL